jgi:hypothetical protein
MSTGLRIYNFELVGTSSLVMHRYNYQMQVEINAWRNHPDRKRDGLSVKGDDRSPCWTWLSSLHHSNGHVAMPSDSVLAAMSKVASQVVLKGQKTFKGLIESGTYIATDYCDLLIGEGKNRRQIPVADLFGLRELNFDDQVAAVAKMGFELNVKPVRVGQKTHIRVRPLFQHWTVRGQIQVSEPAITDGKLREILDLSGRFAGLLDGRPSSPNRPGRNGKFTAALKAA